MRNDPEKNHPLWFPLRRSLGSFPHFLLSTSKNIWTRLAPWAGSFRPPFKQTPNTHGEETSNLLFATLTTVENPLPSSLSLQYQVPKLHVLKSKRGSLMKRKADQQRSPSRVFGAKKS